MNEDGNVITDTAQNPDADFTNVGNAIPTFEFGWNHKYQEIENPPARRADGDYIERDLTGSSYNITPPHASGKQ